MKTPFVLCTLWIAAQATLALAQDSTPKLDERPVLKESPARLVAVIDSTARANRAAACINVTRQVKQHKLTIFSLVPPEGMNVFKEGEYEVEVVYHPGFASESKTSAGPYHSCHNSIVVAFAGAQAAAGNPALGLRLLKLIAQADPDYFWSTPEDPPMKIQQIISGLESHEKGMARFLKDEQEEWERIVRDYSK